jgi:oligopeptide transport system permease protein
VLDQDYIKTARAKGLQERAIVLRHLLKNAAIPILSVAGPMATTLITGIFVVEQLFSIPGTGRELVASISARDYGVIMGITLFYTFVVAMANLTVDVLYAWVDPRIRLEAQG